MKSWSFEYEVLLFYFVPVEFRCVFYFCSVAMNCFRLCVASQWCDVAGAMSNIQSLFTNKKFTHQKIVHAFNLLYENNHYWNVHQENQQQREFFFETFFTQIVKGLPLMLVMEAREGWDNWGGSFMQALGRFRWDIKKNIYS